MIKKEIKEMLRNKVYLFLLLLPFLLTFFMSEGTKGYLERLTPTMSSTISSLGEVLYTGRVLDARTQFAVSELNFMVLMTSSLLGISILEERKLHIWDRVVAKTKFLFVKILLHYLYAVMMILFSAVLFRWVFHLEFSLAALLILLTVPVMGICIGSLAGMLCGNRAVLSNTVLSVVMLFGYLGGSLSLSSVLAGTKYMNILMHLSPLTLANRVLFTEYLGLAYGDLLLGWLAVNAAVVIVSMGILRRRFRYDAIL